ncbi:hypothetical protein ACKKBG_A28135 [Auxenochlorella protothecoides x Auxenochlorella symbiontica]
MLNPTGRGKVGYRCSLQRNFLSFWLPGPIPGNLPQRRASRQGRSQVRFGQLIGEELALVRCGLMAGLMAKLVVNEQPRDSLRARVWRGGGLPSHIHFPRGQRFHDIALIAWSIRQANS